MICTIDSLAEKLYFLEARSYKLIFVWRKEQEIRYHLPEEVEHTCNSFQVGTVLLPHSLFFGQVLSWALILYFGYNTILSYFFFCSHQSFRSGVGSSVIHMTSHISLCISYLSSCPLKYPCLSLPFIWHVPTHFWNLQNGSSAGVFDSRVATTGHLLSLLLSVSDF